MNQQENWLDWAFKFCVMIVTVIVIVVARAAWFGFWGLVEKLLTRGDHGRN
jgi:hypothetical protein